MFGRALIVRRVKRSSTPAARERETGGYQRKNSNRHSRQTVGLVESALRAFAGGLFALTVANVH